MAKERDFPFHSLFHVAHPKVHSKIKLSADVQPFGFSYFFLLELVSHRSPDDEPDRQRHQHADEDEAADLPP